MYAVVGCSECSALWLVEGRPETTECRRCGSRHRFDSLKKFAETEDEAAARDARSRLLADRSDREVEGFSELGDRVEDAAVDDEEYLAASGIDPEEVADAADRGGNAGGNRSRREIVRDAVRSVDPPTEESIVAHAAERGVPAAYVRDALARLVRRGEATENGGEYRLL